jgi:hypothetical protein
MPEFAVYRVSDGRILRSGSVSHAADVPLQTGGEAGVAVLNLGDGDGVQIDDRAWMASVVHTVPALAPRPTLAFNKLEIDADGTDEAVMTGLPASCTVRVNGVPYSIPDGVLRLAADVPATYVVEISDVEAFPFQKFRAEVVAS